MVWSEAIDPPGRAEPEEVGGDRHVHGAGSDQFVGQPGQQPLHRLLAAREDDVQVVALGDSRAVRRMVREAVALDDRDSPEVTRESLGGEQAGHAGTHDDGVILSGLSHAPDDATQRASSASGE